jgi:hypothetical protein
MSAGRGRGIGTASGAAHVETMPARMAAALSDVNALQILRGAMDDLDHQTSIGKQL